MNRRSVMGVMVMAAALVSAQAMLAAPAAGVAFQPKVYGKVKLVKFTIRNDSGATLKVKAGDTAMTLEPGKPMNVALPEGAQIVATEAAPGHESGDVIVTVSSSYSGNTVAVR